MLSMTGYGRATKTVDGRTVTVELKSVNHRFLDISMRMPSSFAFLEETARKAISSRINRGHIEASVTYLNERSDARSVQADVNLAQAYGIAIEQINASLGIDKDNGKSDISHFPDVLVVKEAEEDENALKELLLEALNDALDRLISMRSTEGNSMQRALTDILSEIEAKSYVIDERYPQTVLEYQKRLTERLTELTGAQLDPARIAQECAIMADKAAIDEETVRLRTHIVHAREKCASNEPIGRSLDFLVQEMNREVNTISSKSQDIAITNAVLDCKSAIEKLREQLQNIE